MISVEVYQEALDEAVISITANCKIDGAPCGAQRFTLPAAVYRPPSFTHHPSKHYLQRS